MLGLSGMASMGIGLAVVMDDQFTKVSSDVRREVGLLGKDMRDFNDGLARVEAFGNGMANVGDKIVTMGMDSFKAYAKLDDIVNSTRATIGGMSRDSGDYKDLYNQTKALSDQWGILSNEVAGAQLELSKAGKTKKEIMDMTEVVLVLAAASDELKNVPGVTVMLSDIMNIYGAGSEKAGHFANIMVSAANRSTIGVTSFYESLKYSADIAKQLRIPVEETAAVIASMGNAGLKGSMGGVAYANMLRYLSKAISPFAGKKQTHALSLLGIDPKSLRTAEGTLKPMTDILNIFREKSQGLSPIDLQNTLGEIFNVRGNRGFEPLLNGFADPSGKMGDFEKMLSLINSDLKNNIALTTAKEKTEDDLFPLTQLTQGWENFKTSVGEALAPVITPALKLATYLLNRLSDLMSSPFGKWLVRAAFIMGGGLSIIGRIIGGGARFMGYILMSAGRLQTAFQTATMSSNIIRTNLMAGAMAIQTAALKAKGITGFTSAGGAAMLVGRTPAGRFAGGAVKSNILSRTLGTLFGFKGLRWASGIMKFFKPLAGMFGWLSKTLGFFRILGGVLGRVLGFLFGWWGILADLILTLTTGKGLFEWLWEGLKWLGGVFGIGSPEEKKNTNTLDARMENFQNSKSAEKKWTLPEQTVQKWVFDKPKDTKINIIVNPTTGDQRTERKINLNTEKDLNSYSIN